MGEKLDVSKLSPNVESLQKALLSKIVGQERAIKEIIRAYVPTTVNMHRKHRPMGVFLFMGPTGVGKSETVKIFAKYLLGDRNAITKIDCTEYQEAHETAKLLGSPPGYVGYNDRPRLCQENIDKFQKPEAKFNIVLFDEIEKADPQLFDAIMTILGDGELTLGNGRQVDFSRSFIFLTSNLGSNVTRKLIEGGGIGFQTKSEGERDDLDEQIYRVSKEAVKKSFRPEFINRLDRIIVFRSLSKESLEKILKIELGALQERIWKSPFEGFDIEDKNQPLPNRRSITFKLTDEAKDFLIEEGTSDVYGARELNRAVDRYLSFPLASLISSEQLEDGDTVKVDRSEGEKELSFYKEEKRAAKQLR